MVAELAEIEDRFEVFGLAAKGGMGSVYKACDRTTGQTVAIKLLHGSDRENVARFEREAAILADLSHPAIVRYVAHGQSGGRPYLAMEWVEGDTVDARLERTGFTIADTIELGWRTAQALGYAHERGVVHRDIKPTNLILRRGELSRVAILDFGVARTGSTGSLTSTGALVGTPAYMAPEQARGERSLGPPVDVFALGCVLYECLTTRRAFEGKHVLALIAKVVLWDPPRMRITDPDIPEELDDAVARMLAKDPHLRPRDGNEVAALLKPIVGTATGARRTRARTPTTARVRVAETPTIDTRGGSERRLASIVIATPPAAADGSDLPPDDIWVDRAPMIAALEQLGIRHEILRDGSILAAVTAEAGLEPLGLIGRALRAARKIQDLAPDALIAIATGEIGGGDALTAMVGTMIDTTVGALAREAMAMVFAGVSAPLRPVGAIRIDERTAQILPPEAVLRVKSTCYVRGDAEVPAP